MKNSMGNKKSKKQIFYDPTKSRWKRFISTGIFVSAVCAVVFGIFLVSLLRNNELPSLPIHESGPPVHDNNRSSETGRPLNFGHNNEYRRHNIPRSSSQYSTIQVSSGQDSSPRINEQQTVTRLNHDTENSYESEVIAFHVGWDSNSLASLKEHADKIDEVITEWFYLADGSGKINRFDTADKTSIMPYLREYHPDLRIVALVNNFDTAAKKWNSRAIHQMLNDPGSRSRTIQSLFNEVKERKFSGIHIDFENISPDDSDNLVLFMHELSRVFHSWGLEVSQSIPATDPAYDVAAIGQYLDFIVLLAYDQHVPDVTKPGPIASQNWYENELRKKLSQLPSDKIVVALGNYGYDWIENDTKGVAVTFHEAMAIAKKSNATISIYPDDLNPGFSYKDEKNETHRVWYLDAVSSFNQIVFASAYRPRGYALWRLGSEDPSIWKLLENPDNLNSSTAGMLSSIPGGEGFRNSGKGEVIKITEKKKNGSRFVKFDPERGYVTQERIIEYPSSYEVTRWGGGDPQKIVLTFDDGPHPKYTPMILDILEEHSVSATFFLIGSNAVRYPEIVKRIVAEGHEIGHHTFTHPGLSTIPDSQLRLEMNSLQLFLEGTINRNTVLFRASYGEDTDHVISSDPGPLITVSDMGYYTVRMEIDPKDWKPGVTAGEITGRVMDDVSKRKGNVILFHDGGGDRSATVNALPEIISGLDKNGFEIVSLAQLIGVSSEKVMPPVIQNRRVISCLNNFMFRLLGSSSKLLVIVFGTCVAIGILRSLLMAVLAIVRYKQHRIKNRSLSSSPDIKVSVIIPAYNEENVICKTVHSLLQSTLENFEIIAVDDGSTDGTYRRLQDSFSENPRVRIFSIPNSGKSAALNYGIKKSSADVIITLDADTVFLPDTIEKLTAPFSDPNIGAVAGNAKVGNRVNYLTCCQAVEYITSQNLERRGYDLMNSIPVVPGAVGAWRRNVVIEAGGFSEQTLAEDADLTFSVIRAGYRVVYEENAKGYTEAPDTIKNFIKQRVRWMYGMLQTAWKHRRIFLRRQNGGLGTFTIPSIWVFQVIFPLIAPIIELTIMFSIASTIWQAFYHPMGNFSIMTTLQSVIIYYVLFLLIDLLLSAVSFFLEKDENKRMIVWSVFQRFFYRYILSFVAIKTIVMIIKGSLVGWNKFERKATVEI
jgi:cellulose synthase/poly-beta-1,6-N-acetylglucosamine synthase-like glycosyltransferase/spore germination protein YaaH/peptidoglycan/xylan/chitin deacetylase (PgdA/CDA1 family)